MTNNDVLELHRNLNQDELKTLKGIKLVYAIDKNLTKLEGEVKSIEAAQKPSKKFEEYEEKRIGLNETYAEKDENKVPKMKNIDQWRSEYVIDESKKPEYDKKMDELTDEFSDEIKKREKQLKDFDKFLKDESDFKPYQIDSEIIPEDIEWGQYRLIRKLVK